MTINGGYVNLSNDIIDGGLTLNSATVELSNGSQVLDSTGTVPAAISLTNSNLDINGVTTLSSDVTLTNSNLYLSNATPVLSALNTDDGNLAGGSADPNWMVNGAPAVVLSDGAENNSSANNVYTTADNAVSGWIGSRTPGPNRPGLIASRPPSRRPTPPTRFWPACSTMSKAAA